MVGTMLPTRLLVEFRDNSIPFLVKGEVKETTHITRQDPLSGNEGPREERLVKCQDGSCSPLLVQELRRVLAASRYGFRPATEISMKRERLQIDRAILFVATGCQRLAPEAAYWTAMLCTG